MRWRRISIVLAVCVALAAIVFALTPREPKYEGRTLSEWIKEANPRHSAHYQQRKDFEAVRHIGTNAFPWLIRWLSLKDPPAWRLKLLAVSQRLPQWIQDRMVHQILGDVSNEHYREMAVDGFVILGPEASPAVIDLLQIQASSANAQPVGLILDKIGAAARPPALCVLTNRSNSIELRYAAAAWLFHYDPHLPQFRYDPNPDQKFIISVMAECIRGNHAKLAPRAAHILAYYRAEPEVTLPLVIKNLRDPDVDVRAAAVTDLRQYGLMARPAVPALVLALNDPHPLVQELAEDALFEIDSEALKKASPARAKWQWRPTQTSGDSVPR